MNPDDEKSEELTLTAAEAAALRQEFRYCPRCRAEMVDKRVYGRVRRVCPAETCRFVQFIDPKVSVAVIAVRDGKALMVKRAMNPGKDSWCFPGGFMEIGETAPAAAIRECKEESDLNIEIVRLVDVFYYEDYRGSGVLIMYKGKVVGGQANAGDDAKAVAFFGPDELPDHIVFESNIETLACWRAGKI